MRSIHILGAWRCRLNLSMFLLTISVGRFWIVQSVLEFNAIKKNLRIMSDMERVVWTILFRMASRVFLFFTPSDSSLVRNWFVCKEPRTPVVKLIWEAFQPLFSRWLRWFMKPRWELYLSVFSSFPAQNGECFENVRDKSHSLDDREHGCPILSQPEGTECASQRRAIYCCDFPRIAAGKTIFLHPRSPT